MEILFAIINLKKKYIQSSSRRVGQIQAHCSLDPCEKNSVKFQLNYISFHRNYISKYRAQNGGHIVSDRYGYLNVTIWFSCGKLLKVSFYGATKVKRYFPEFFCVLLYVGMTPQTVIGLHSVWVRDMSGIRRFWFGNVSANSMQFGVMGDLIRSWIGLESVSGRPTYVRYITDLRPTNHLPSVAELRPTRPRTLPGKTDTTPTYNRQKTDNLSGRELSNMFERSLPDKFVCPNIKRHQTDKTESIPTVNRSLPEFDAFCRFEVGFVSVWSVWLGYNRENVSIWWRHQEYAALTAGMEISSWRLPYIGSGVIKLSPGRPLYLSEWFVNVINSDNFLYFPIITT